MKSYKQCCAEVAVKHKLGKSLVAGHLSKYWEEAALIFADQFRQAIIDYVQAGAEAKKYGVEMNSKGEYNGFHELDFQNGAHYVIMEFKRKIGDEI